MNVKACANCVLHGWKQPQNKDDLQKCKRCKQIKYCGKACQTEHWQKIHKRHCRYFADLALAQASKHNEATCTICLQAAGVGNHQLRNPENANYFCLYKSPEWKLLEMSDLHHDHPFAVTGQPGNTREKLIIVLWQLAYKFKQSQLQVIPRIANFSDELKKMIRVLQLERLYIWKQKKIYPHPEYFNSQDIAMFLNRQLVQTVNKERERLAVEDPFQLWKTIELVDNITMDEYLLGMLSALKDPLTSLPTELRHLVSRVLENKTKFLKTVNQVLDALLSQVIPYEDVLKIICGGSLKQNCSFCSKRIIITGINDGPVVFSQCMFTLIFLCDAKECRANMGPILQDMHMFGSAISASVNERKAHRCDFCSLLCPAGDVHRCSRCYTTMYCTKSCQLKDWKIHQIVCDHDQVERKKKLGDEGRKEESREAREVFKGHFSDVGTKAVCEMLEKCGIQKDQKKARK